MAFASPRVRAECIEANEYPELSQRYQVMAVPKIVINDRVGFEGALPERDFLGAVLQAVNGGGPAGSRSMESAPAPGALPIPWLPPGSTGPPPHCVPTPTPPCARSSARAQ